MTNSYWLLSLLVALLGAQYVVQHYWYYVPRWSSYFTLLVHEYRPNHWNQSVASDATQNGVSGRRKPNIVFIVADDLGYNDITFYGGGISGGSVPTPHIDSIGRAGVSFPNGYAGHATCSPSRAAIMTGRYATRFGFEFTPVPLVMSKVLGAADPHALRSNRYFAEREKDIIPIENMTFPRSEFTIAEQLRTHGYHNVLVGKWHLGHSEGHRPVERGFDEFLGFNLGASLYMPADLSDTSGGSRATQGVGVRLDDFADKFLWANLRFFVESSNATHSTNFQPNKYMTDYLAEEAAAAVRANQNRPFFLYLAFNAPHTPLQALRSDYDALSHISDHRERVYGAMVRALDRGVGTVLDAIKEAGLEEDTLVAFTSDNGAPHYICVPGANHPYRGWKGTLFEGGLKVPFLMKWPRKTSSLLGDGNHAEGLTVEQPVAHVDLFATAVAAATEGDAASGAAPAFRNSIDGVSLLPFIEAAARTKGVYDPAVPSRAECDAMPFGEVSQSCVKAHYPHETLFWRSGEYKSLHYLDRYKLQSSQYPKKEWLFNLRLDPTEQNNLVDDPASASLLAFMRERLRAEDAAQARPSWPALSATYVPVDVIECVPQRPEHEYVLWEN